MGSSLPRALCIQRDSGQEGSGGKCRPGWGGPASPALLCWGRGCWTPGLDLGKGTTVPRRGTRPICGRALIVPPRPPRGSQEGHQSMGMPEVTGPRVPWALRGPRGPGSAGELGLNWKQVLGTSRRGGRVGVQGRGERGAHLAAEGWQEASRWPGPPVLGCLGVPGGRATARCCAAVSGVSSPSMPRILREALPCASSAERAGETSPAPRSSGPGFLSRRVCLLQRSALSPSGSLPPHPPPTTPRPLAPFLLLPAAPQLPIPGDFSPLSPPDPGAASCAPGSELASLPGQRKAGGSSVEYHLLLFFSCLSQHFPLSRSAGTAQRPTSPSITGREKPGEPQGAWPWAAGAWAAEAGVMLVAGSSHRLRGADRIQGLEQLREQGSSKRQMVLDGSQGRVSGVGNRSQSSPGQGRGNQAEAGRRRRRVFAQPVSGARGRAGGTDPCPSSQERQLTPRAGHSCSDSSVAFARHVPGKLPSYPCGVQGPGYGTWLHRSLGPSAAHVPCPHECACPHRSARSRVCTSFCGCVGSPETRGFTPRPSTSPASP